MTSSLKQNSKEIIERRPGESYNDHLKRIIANAERITFTDEENFQIMKDLSKGMEEFLWQEKQIQAATLIEMRGIILD